LEFEKAVADAGTEAVLRYRAMAGLARDNEIPNSVLRAFVAEHLHRSLGLPVRVDRLLAAVARELGQPLDNDILEFFGGCRADVAVYQDGRPSLLVQLTIFDAATHLPPGGPELDRIDFLARTGKLRASIGVMICPFVVPLEARIERLHDLFGGNMYVGERQESQDRKWHWCFAAASLGATRRAP